MLTSGGGAPAGGGRGLEEDSAAKVHLIEILTWCLPFSDGRIVFTKQVGSSVVREGAEVGEDGGGGRWRVAAFR